MLHIEERVVLDDGEATTLERWGERGPVFLCVHGMTSSRKSWERFALHYQDRARIYAFDQRGHGDSAGVRGPMTLHRSLLDLYNVMDAIRDKVDVLAGHSWGGAIAILGGRRFDVDRIVAIDPMIRQAQTAWYDEFLADLRKLFAYRGEARDAKVREEYASWSELDRERKVHAVREMSLLPIEKLRDENPPENWDLRRDLERYPKPLFLALAGSGQSIVRWQDLRSVRESAGSNVALRVFEGGDHNLHRTAFDDFVTALDGFLERTRLFAEV